MHDNISIVQCNITMKCTLFNAQELTLYRFGFKCDTNRIKKYFLSEPRFEPGYLERITGALSNSATLPL
jgi:hypothetical protein